MTKSKQEQIKKLFRLGERRAKLLTNELNGDPHPNQPAKLPKSAHAGAWERNRLATEAKLEDLAYKLSLKVEYDGLYPSFRAKDGSVLYMYAHLAALEVTTCESCKHCVLSSSYGPIKNHVCALIDEDGTGNSNISEADESCEKYKRRS